MKVVIGTEKEGGAITAGPASLDESLYSYELKKSRNTIHGQYPNASLVKTARNPRKSGVGIFGRIFVLSKSFKIRQMTREEMNIAIDWAATEGWNPGHYDADYYFPTYRSIVFLV